MLFEVKVELEDTPIEGTFEPMALRHLPFPVHDGEGYVLIRRTCLEPNRQSIIRTVLLQVELGGFGLVSQVRVENVELVPLDDLRRRVLRVVVHLVVLVPLVALLYAVEEPWLSANE